MSDFFNSLLDVLKAVRWQDILDIAIVSFLIYQFVIFVKNSRAQLLVKGIIIIVVVYLISVLLNLHTLMFIVDLIIKNGVFAVLLVFQPEIRSVIEKLGKSKISLASILRTDSSEHERAARLSVISTVVESFRQLQEEGMGAIVVFERSVKLDDIVSTGTLIDSAPSAGLLGNIFFNKAPLHDGAVVIRDNRIVAAGCILPLTQNAGLGIELGTRHRAAIGMSENSDAVVAVLSEENGTLSVTEDGVIKRYQSFAAFSSDLIQALCSDERETDGEGSSSAIKKKFHNVTGIFKDKFSRK
ncbi:MAG: diadenylate cyclase CdaA [Oscillospiraceae bacterium]|jgi:diadenylate cyclase|nr:diadenylate cyclase CdaA [Oscillospiraceae bacterium]